MQRIELGAGAFCDLYERWLDPDASTSLYMKLARDLPWEARKIRIFGREVMQPRLVAWIGDADAVYTYSGTRHDPLPWPAALREVRVQLCELLDVPFNSVLCNLYRDGKDSMGMHSDSEPELGPSPVIASLSLGATRTLRVRARDKQLGRPIDLALEDGSLLVMHGAMQRTHRHGVPKELAITAPRINLTFRRVLPA